MKIKFSQGKIDLQKLDGVDALVNSTDVFCSGGGGFDQQVHAAAGAGLAGELKAIQAKKPKNFFNMPNKKMMADGGALVTDGHGLSVKKIIHAAVPHKSGDSIEPLTKCYENALMAAEHTEGCKTVAVRLMGTGFCGWTPAESISALWQAIMNFHKKPENMFSDNIETLHIFHPQEVQQFVWHYESRASRAFFVKPDGWGLRGDPFLWFALMEHFDNPKFDRISPRNMILEIQRFYHEKTGRWLSADTDDFVQEFAHGGMSSGGISGFMALRGIPLLCRTLSEITFHLHTVAMVQAAEMDNAGHKSVTMLPLEAIPDLALLCRNRSEMNDRIYVPMPGGKLLTVHHYPGRPDMIDFCFLDDRRISAKAVYSICKELKCDPADFPAALHNFLRSHTEDDLFDWRIEE